MTPLIVVLPYHNGDVDLARLLLEHIERLSRKQNFMYSILLVADSGVDPAKNEEMMGLARRCFWTGASIRLTITSTGWPKAANQMFEYAAKHIRSSYRAAFLWLEPDCVPLTPDWLDKIADAYERCPQKFMGPLVENKDQPGLPAVHLSGCSVYPNDAFDIMADHCKGEAAFDIASADVVVKLGRARDTKLIAHMWGLRDLPPTFVSERTPESPKNAMTLDQIPNGAVLWHRCKDGTLFSVLRKASPALMAALEVAYGQESKPQEYDEVDEKLMVACQEEANADFNKSQTDDLKKQAMNERMAKMRAMRGQKRPVEA
jgi:hypothetical protein